MDHSNILSTYCWLLLSFLGWLKGQCHEIIVTRIFSSITSFSSYWKYSMGVLNFGEFSLCFSTKKETRLCRLHQWVWTPWCSLRRGVWTHRWRLHRQVWTPRCSLRRWVKNISVAYTEDSKKIFFPTKNHQRRLHRVVWTPQCSLHQRVWTHWCRLHWRVQTPRCSLHQWVISPNWTRRCRLHRRVQTPQCSLHRWVISPNFKACLCS